MRLTVIAAVGAAAFVVPTLAGADSMSQPTSNEIAIWAYPTKVNYCPAGLQPVRVNGVVCCGKPTHTGYSEHRVRRHRTTYVAYGKGFDDAVVQEGKGYTGN